VTSQRSKNGCSKLGRHFRSVKEPQGTTNTSKGNYYTVLFEVLRAVTMKIIIFWDIMPYSLVVH
jgi:hypothetical protein